MGECVSLQQSAVLPVSFFFLIFSNINVFDSQKRNNKFKKNIANDLVLQQFMDECVSLRQGAVVLVNQSFSLRLFHCHYFFLNSITHLIFALFNLALNKASNSALKKTAGNQEI